MAKIFADIKGLDAAIKKMNEAGYEKLQEADMIMGEAAVGMARMAKKLAPVNDGALRNSIGFTREGFLKYEVFSNIFYAPYIEFGTKSYVRVPPEFEQIAQQARGRKSKGDFQDLVLAIAKWIKKKGIGGTKFSRISRGKNAGKTRKNNKATNEMQLNLAWVIAYTIIKKGIRRQPFFYPSYKYYTNKMFRELYQKFK